MLTVLEVVCYIFGVNKSVRKTQVSFSLVIFVFFSGKEYSRFFLFGENLFGFYLPLKFCLQFYN